LSNDSNVYAKSLPEFSVVREMSGVGDVLAPRIFAKIQTDTLNAGLFVMLLFS